MNKPQPVPSLKNPRKFKHELDGGIGGMRFAFEHLAPMATDERAINIFRKALKKLNALSDKIGDDLKPTTQDAKALGYNGTKETVYTEHHPEVIQWTKYFLDRTQQAHIFQTFELRNESPAERKAKIVAVLWHQFSEFMPAFLCQAAAQVSRNDIRHYIVQTAFEELGMRDVNEIHPDMFWKAAEGVGITGNDVMRLGEPSGTAETLDTLKAHLLNSKSDAETLGMLLGLEIPAKENIECLFSSLAHSEDSGARLREDRFFVIHRQVEPEHVRLTISNFLRFCATDEARARFEIGFDHGIQFWKKFWDRVSEIIDKDKMRGQGCA